MLFPLIVGGSFEALPPVLRAFHAPMTTATPETWRGRADIEAPSGPAAAAVARLFGFPAAGAGIPVAVSVSRRDEPRGPAEIWARDFGGRRMISTLRNRHGVLTETFGPLVFPLDVRADARGLAMVGRGWRLGPLPLPRGLAPRSTATEHQDQEGRFRFDIEIGAPLLGRLVRYRGWLVRAAGVANT